MMLLLLMVVVAAAVEVTVFAAAAAAAAAAAVSCSPVGSAPLSDHVGMSRGFAAAGQQAIVGARRTARPSAARVAPQAVQTPSVSDWLAS